MLKNYPLIKYLNTDVDNFTSDNGLKMRRLVSAPLKKILKIATPEKIHIARYPELEKDTPYIFVSNHSFSNDIIAALATIDRSVYLLMGSTNQVEYNKLFYAAWINGFIYVNRLDKESRAQALPKMERVINSGSSMLIFPEGGHNNTENSLCNKLFAGVFYLAKSTKAKVVPIAQYYEFGGKDIFINVGDPIDMDTYDDKTEAMAELRDVIATMVWDNIEKYSTPIIRNELTGDFRANFMEQKRQEYLKNPWTRDVWEEELTRYLDSGDKEYLALIQSFETITATIENARHIAPFLVSLNDLNRYDFKKYMHNYWDK